MWTPTLHSSLPPRHRDLWRFTEAGEAMLYLQMRDLLRWLRPGWMGAEERLSWAMVGQA
jgi:hypothetical protein